MRKRARTYRKNIYIWTSYLHIIQLTSKDLLCVESWARHLWQLCLLSLSLAEDSSIVLETTCTEVFSLVDVSIPKFLNYTRFLSSFVLDSLSTLLLTIDWSARQLNELWILQGMVKWRQNEDWICGCTRMEIVITFARAAAIIVRGRALRAGLTKLINYYQKAVYPRGFKAL